ncbi:hypothetical protein ACFX11_006705 [Malus domestica]
MGMRNDVVEIDSLEEELLSETATERHCVDLFIAHEGHVNGIAINQEDGCVFTCSSDGSVKIWRRVFGESSHILNSVGFH